MKKAIIVVSFGTTHADAEASCIRPVERALAAAFPDRDVHRAWTSRIIARRLATRGETVENETEALARLRAEGCGDIAFVCTHMIRGKEYERVLAVADGLPVSAPLLDTEGDLEWMAGLLDGIAAAEGRTLLVMGHGTDHAADETYARLRTVLTDRVKLACVEGRHALEGILDALEAVPGKALTLMPLMLVAGDHAMNDLAGDAPDSWKNILLSRGFDVRARLTGLGALEPVQRRFVEKAGAALKG
jgi:sirohydrochlorin cobaltochelatase